MSNHGDRCHCAKCKPGIQFTPVCQHATRDNPDPHCSCWSAAVAAEGREYR